MSLALCRGKRNGQQEMRFVKGKKKRLAILSFSVSPENLKTIYSAISEKCCGQKWEEWGGGNKNSIQLLEGLPERKYLNK